MIHGTAEAATGDRLDPFELTLKSDEEFTAPLSVWDPRSAEGRWKTRYWFGSQLRGGYPNVDAKFSVEIVID